MHNHFDKHLCVRDLIREQKPAVVVECGVFTGANTAQLLDLQKEIPFRLICITDQAYCPKEDVHGHLPAPSGNGFTWMTGLSYEILPTFPDGQVDFCSIDTDHNYWTLRRELDALHPKLPVGGIVVMHDTQTYRKNSGKADMYGTGDRYPDEEIDAEFKKGKGMGDAIWEFLARHQNYIVRRHVIESHGAMALEKVDA